MQCLQSIIMIVIKPTGGLANRMRALDSAISLSKKHQLSLHLIWELDPTCNCKFTDLFVRPDGINSLVQVKAGVKTKFLNVIARLYFYCMPNHSYINQPVMDKLLHDKSDCEELLSTQHTYISTDSRFYTPLSKALFSTIQPKDSLQNIIDSYSVQNMIGVHIRRTDNKVSIANSPTKKFIDQMKKEAEKDKHVRFFLATDDPSTETAMREIFKGKIITHVKKSLNRNDASAIKDAVIDLYCLAGSRKIIGSFWSSFSDVAAQINDREIVIIKAKQ